MYKKGTPLSKLLYLLVSMCTVLSINFAVAGSKHQKSPLVKLSWSKAEGAYSYEIAIYDTKGLSRRIFSKKTYKYVRFTNLKTISWRVRPLNSDKKPITKFSKKKILKLARNIGNPKINAPFIGEKLKPLAIESVRHVHFRWQAIRNSIAYEIEIAKSQSFQKPVTQLVLKQREIKEYPVTAGVTYWRVRSVGKTEKSLWSYASFYLPPALVATPVLTAEPSTSASCEDQRSPASLRKKKSSLYGMVEPHFTILSSEVFDLSSTSRFVQSLNYYGLKLEAGWNWNPRWSTGVFFSMHHIMGLDPSLGATQIFPFGGGVTAKYTPIDSVQLFAAIIYEKKWFYDFPSFNSPVLNQAFIPELQFGATYMSLYKIGQFHFDITGGGKVGLPASVSTYISKFNISMFGELGVRYKNYRLILSIRTENENTIATNQESLFASTRFAYDW